MKHLCQKTAELTLKAITMAAGDKYLVSGDDFSTLAMYFQVHQGVWNIAEIHVLGMNGGTWDSSLLACREQDPLARSLDLLK